ncbi:unnamed protein product [Pedinophyceae sp. YPF-701]|nr:unnamed protein product [Pedinophyceae sp. YPF-701]
MPKTKKRKNPGVGVDFKRVKSKVGKPLPKARNETDTTIRAQSIHLPGTGLLDDKSTQATSLRNLTLPELLTQSGHYSAKVRRDALDGLADLFSHHPAEVQSSAGPLLQRIGERASDEDKDVRKALLALLQAHVLRQLDERALAAHLPLLMAHVLSGLASLDAGVRADSACVLQELVRHSPSAVAGGYLEPCAAHFSAQLAPSARGVSIRAQSSAALVQTLTGLHHFLSGTVSALSAASARPRADIMMMRGGGASASGSRWRPAPWLGVQELRKAHARIDAALDRAASERSAAGNAGVELEVGTAAVLGLLLRLLRCYKELVGASEADDEGGAGELGTGKKKGGKAGAGNKKNARRESSSSGKDEESKLLSAMVLVAESVEMIVRILIARAGERGAPELRVEGEKATSTVGAALGALSDGFPRRRPTGAARGGDAAQKVASVNLAIARTLSRVLPSPPNTPPATDVATESTPGPAWEGTLLAFLCLMMRSDDAAPAHGRDITAKAAGAETPNGDGVVVGAAVDMAGIVLPRVQGEGRAELLQCTLTVFEGAKPGTSTCVRCLELLQHIAERPADVYVHGVAPEAALTAAVRVAPKVLWDCGARNQEASLRAAKLLHTVARFSFPGGTGEVDAALRESQQPLAALFCAVVPGKARETERVISGPLLRLPEAAQALVCDIVPMLPVADRVLLRACALAALSPELSASCAARLSAALASRRGLDGDPAAWTSCMVTLLTGVSSIAPPGHKRKDGHALLMDDQDRRRAIETAGIAAEALASAGDSATSLAVLSPAVDDAVARAAEHKHGSGLLRAMLGRIELAARCVRAKSPAGAVRVSEALCQQATELLGAVAGAAGAGHTSSVQAREMTAGARAVLAAADGATLGRVVEGVLRRVEEDHADVSVRVERVTTVAWALDMMVADSDLRAKAAGSHLASAFARAADMLCAVADEVCGVDAVPHQAGQNCRDAVQRIKQVSLDLSARER